VRIREEINCSSIMQYNDTSESKFCYNNTFVLLLILIIGPIKQKVIRPSSLKGYVQKEPVGKDGGYRVLRHISFSFQNIGSIQEGEILTFKAVET